jgi:macrolide-specific efflux system membrane fusion protein
VNNVVLYDALFDVENPNQALMTQMTAQVFFVASSAKAAVLVPIAALRPAAAEGRPRVPRAPGTAKGASGTGKGPDAGAARKGGGERASGIDPRSQYANGRALLSVVGADGTVADREVKVGVMNRVSAQILSGLEPGEKVVIGTKAPAGAAPAAAPAKNGSALTPNAQKGGGRP